MKQLTRFLFIFIFSIASFAQDAKGPKEEKALPEPKSEKKQLPVYTTIVLEDFETTQFPESSITYRNTGYQKGGIAIRDQYPSPAKDSKKYLGIKILGKAGDVIQLTPPKRLVIDKYCQSIAMWVYGKDLSGELSIMIRDSEGTSHRLIMGRLNFTGWRELRVNLPKEIAQMDKYLSQKTEIEITKIMYNPGNTGRLPVWNYLYIDDITAVVREKMYDRQSDEW
ncbi:MAG: flagellar filament outer layer protein FlaA [Spirochaetes bacterium]|nr:flagellar filament outer layer protein FlaA [Spirochaetota bacterium]